MALCHWLQRSHSRKAAHDLLNDIALHLAVQQALFRLFSQHSRLVKTDIALLQNLGCSNQLCSPGAAQLEPKANAGWLTQMLSYLAKVI